MSKFLSTFFQRQMEKFTEEVNDTLNPQSLGLSSETFPLPFNNMLATGGTRAALKF